MAAKMAYHCDRRRLIGVGDGRMYVVLLILGAGSSLAGLMLVASGVQHDGAATFTPGAIAVVGGLILIGLGLVVRELQRIERVLLARPMPRTSRPGEGRVAALERPNAPSGIPFPPKPQPQSASAAQAPASADPALESLRNKFPNLVRLEAAPVVDDGNVSLLPMASARAEEVVAESGVVAVRANSGGSARRAAGAARRPKGSMFDSFWPKGSRGSAEAQTATAQAAGPAVELSPRNEAFAEVPAATNEPRAAAVGRQAPARVTILKSGVVEGMAYTLYSDGSIEAQLPQGVLRFGSITELRNHIENES